MSAHNTMHDDNNRRVNTIEDPERHHNADAFTHCQQPSYLESSFAGHLNGGNSVHTWENPSSQFELSLTENQDGESFSSYHQQHRSFETTPTEYQHNVKFLHRQQGLDQEAYSDCYSNFSITRGSESMSVSESAIHDPRHSTQPLSHNQNGQLHINQGIMGDMQVIHGHMNQQGDLRMADMTQTTEMIDRVASGHVSDGNDGNVRPRHDILEWRTVS